MRLARARVLAVRDSNAKSALDEAANSGMRQSLLHLTSFQPPTSGEAAIVEPSRKIQTPQTNGIDLWARDSFPAGLYRVLYRSVVTVLLWLRVFAAQQHTSPQPKCNRQADSGDEYHVGMASGTGTRAPNIYGVQAASAVRCRCVFRGRASADKAQVVARCQIPLARR